MAPSLLQHLRQQAGKLAYSSLLYNWSLKSDIPADLLFKPLDPWSGDGEVGRKIAQGHFDLFGEELHAQGHFWIPKNASGHWLDYLHKFEWLRDLRALGGDEGRAAARHYITNWIRHFNRWDEQIWTPARLGKRLSLWLALYDFYGESADEAFQDDLLKSCLKQARHLYRIMPSKETGLDVIEALQGLIYAGLAIPGGERWLDYGLDAIAYEAEQQILADGGHISRNPQALLRVVMCFSDIRTALTSADYPLPHAVQYALDRAIPALRFFRYPDKAFGVFNGAQEQDDPALERLIINFGGKGRVPKSLPKSGYERLSAGRAVIMVDTGNAPAWPYDRHAHTAPAAFELSIGKERVFVSCGTHPMDTAWQDMLRGTAAHNTLTLDHRNAMEIRENGHIGRRPKKIISKREDIDAGQLLTVTHDGYIPVNGILHQRRLFVDNNGTDIRGEETLTAKTGSLTKPVAVTLRFHLHPRVLVSLIRDGEEALLLLPNGAGWRFYHEGAQLALENSIYLGEGTYPRKTKQLVLSCDMTEAEQIIQWTVQKESL